MPRTLRAFVVGCAAAATVAAIGAPAVAAPPATAPTITELSPAYGPVGATLDIRGSGLTGTTYVVIGRSDPITPSSVTDTDVLVTVPASATSGVVVAHQATASVTGPRFTVQHATRAVETTSHRVVTYPAKTTVRATLTRASDGKALGGERAWLQRRLHGATVWRTLKGTHVRHTSHRGLVKWTVAPKQNVALRVRFAPSESRLGTYSNTQFLAVRPGVRLSAPTTVQAREPATLTGSVTPHLPGRVLVQRRSHGDWHTVARPAAHHGAFTASVTVSQVGAYRFRALRPATPGHRSAKSPRVTVHAVARTLRLGSTGADVRALQKRLRALHYDVGPVNGSFGYDTLHAVTAFEKVQGMARDGVASAAVLAKLSHPKRFHLRHPIRNATAVEVDLSRQVLVLAKNGHVWRILDTSTAGGYYYTNSQGQSEKAVTPTGHFAIRYKQEGTVHARLGTLYRPSYFNYDGYAIHGEGNGNGGDNVPPYPNSHGCVRITDLAVDRYYNTLAVGVSVWIYQ